MKSLLRGSGIQYNISICQENNRKGWFSLRQSSQINSDKIRKTRWQYHTTFILLKRFPVWFNLFVLLFLVTPCLVVVFFSLALSESQLKKMIKNIAHPIFKRSSRNKFWKRLWTGLKQAWTALNPYPIRVVIFRKAMK